MKNSPISLIIGAGEVGKSLFNVLSPYHTLVLVDREPVQVLGDIEIMHVCFGYGPDFIAQVKGYQERYKPRYTIIHSTVPVGVSRQCNAIHSPIVGIHPYLEEGIRTFTRFLGGEDASQVAQYFKRAGLKVYLFDKPETTELMKKLDTTFYVLCIEYTKEIKRLAE